MDVTGLLRGDFGKHTGLVKSLAKEIMRLQEHNTTLLKVIERRWGRPPVLVVCHPQEIYVHCTEAVSLKAIDAPRGDFDSDALERYLCHKAGLGHEGLLYHARHRWGPFNGNGCLPVEKLLRGRYANLVRLAVEEVAAQREEWDRMITKKGA